MFSAHAIRVTPLASLLAVALIVPIRAIALDGPAPLFADGAELGTSISASEVTVARERLVRINFDVLVDVDGSPRRPLGALRLDLFADVVFDAVITSVIDNSPVSHSWIGHLAGIDASDVTFVVSGDVMVGRIGLPGAVYQIRYVGNGVHAVREINESALPREGPPIVPKLGENQRLSDSSADDGSLIDVLVVYTPAARAAAGGTTAMEAEIDLAITTSNASYANSGITQRLRLVHAAEVAYGETGSMGLDLGRLQSPVDGFMDEVPVLRDTFGADVVSLVLEAGDYCGLGYVMTQLSLDFAPVAYSTVLRICASANYSFPHELGHNMGAHHDWYANPSDTGPYPYNHGYVDTVARWRTVMAYDSQCNDLGFSCTRLPFWSNPEVSYGGAPMGVPEGVYHPADNHKTLNNTAYTVANFRTASEPPSAATLIAPSGTITTALPIYEWNAVTTAGRYYLSVRGAGDGVIATWYTRSAVCSGSVCRVTPSTALTNGDYEWAIQTWNSSGYGPWSSPLAFTVKTITSVPTVTTFSINGGAASTTNPVVTLNNTATGSPTEYQASESSTFAEAAWQPYSPAPSFTLSAANGVKRVYLRVRYADGISLSKSDTISLSRTVTTFSINGGAASTTNPVVTLNNTATGSPTEYQASESSTFAEAAWQPYSPAPSFTLSAANGVKRVYLRVRYADGISPSQSDTISLSK